MKELEFQLVESPGRIKRWEVTIYASAWNLHLHKPAASTHDLPDPLDLTLAS